MEESESRWRGKVFRLRGLPATIASGSEVAHLLSTAFEDVGINDIKVLSLAKVVEWEVPHLKVATLQFNVFPSFFRLTQHKDNWILPKATELDPDLILDSHFIGMTVLNEVEDHLHIADCVAISGLGSHPFGSWQPKDQDKTFMWIRDEMPIYVPGIKTILYGYESNLLQSDSNQLIRDIARSFIEHLSLGRWKSTSRPIVFLAHSLGGLVLKDALVQLASAPDERNHSLINKVLGAIMFGVPNLGMEQSDLQAIVEGQANEVLIEDLSRGSNYLKQLDQSFSGITLYQERIKFFWAYETLSSKTVRRSESGFIDRSGSLKLLVTRTSATRRLYEKEPNLTFPIQKNHSGMVKFPRDNLDAKVVYDKLAKICRVGNHYAKYSNEPRAAVRFRTQDSQSMKPEIDIEEVLKSLDAPDLDLRIDLIKENYKGTFDWVFQHEGFTKWLQSNSGIFWINGKPGSGKSTLMKTIINDNRTQQFLHSLRDDTRLVCSRFFFNYRGSYVQKSFEGLLRSILRQIIMGARDEAIGLLKPHRLPSLEWSMDSLKEALKAILQQNSYRLNLILFFDGLDEFDGPSEMICRFIRDLTEVSEGSLTSIKVCFSSRPWAVFSDAFDGEASLSVHEHTKTDILLFCTGLIYQPHSTFNIPEAVIRYIADRASGVFLWVKLVVDDLISQTAGLQNPSIKDLQEIVRKLPEELDEYYEQIIERIPTSHRMDLYILLELLIRSEHSPSTQIEINLLYILEAAAVSQSRTFSDAIHRLESVTGSKDITFKSATQFIRARTGGLIECYPLKVHPRERETPYWSKHLALIECHVQLMHQTVFDFVTSLRFKSVVLGNLSKVSWENGHSFHFKYLCTISLENTNENRGRDNIYFKYLPTLTAYYGSMSESTTGNSQIEFIRSLSQNALGNFKKLIWRSESCVNSALGLAVLFDLALCVRDWVEDPLWLHSGANDQLITAYVLSIVNGFNREGKKKQDPSDPKTLRLLLNKGYSTSFNPSAFGQIVDSIERYLESNKTPLEAWLVDNALTPDMLPLNLESLDIGRRKGLQDEYQQAQDLLASAIELLKFRQDPNWRNTSYESGRVTGDYPVLHVAPPFLAQKLLEYGANPNAVDESGCTALDYAIERATKPNWTKYWFQKICILVNAGVPVMRSSIKTCYAALEAFNVTEGLDSTRLISHLAASFDNFAWPRRELRLMHRLKARLKRAGDS